MIRSLRRLLPIVTVLAALPATLIAQSREPAPSILSDRPGLGDGSHVLASGVWQVELGGEYVGGGDARFNLGQGLVRGGFGPFELRIYANSLVIEQTDGSSDFGFQDLGIGAKVPLGGPGGWNWAALGLVTFPVGDDDYSANEFTGGGSMLGETSLSESVSLALNAGFFFPFNDVGEGKFAVILTPAFAIPGAPALSGYAGVASYFGHGDDSNFIEAGLAYSRDADTQLDLNWGIDTDSTEWFLGIGWARRWL